MKGIITIINKINNSNNITKIAFKINIKNAPVMLLTILL